MFCTMSSPADRRKYLAQRAPLKSRFLTERLEKQDATAAYKKGIAPLLEPTITTTEQIAKLADTTTKLAQEAQKQSKALENLPEDLAAVLPLAEPPEYHSQIGTTPQVFGEEARQAIAEDAIRFANAGPPANWKTLMQGDTSYDTSKARSAWPRWVYREMTGLKQARGKRFDAFLAALKGDARAAATSSGEGLKPACSGVRYYKNAEELLDRLTKPMSARDILDKLRDDSDIDEPVFEGLWEKFK